MKPCETIKELRKQFSAVKTGVAGDTIFGAKALMFLCEIAAHPKAHTNGRHTRRPTAYNQFFGAGIKAGKTAKEIASEWRSRKLTGKGK